jgi:hypothetical protein
VSWNKTIASDRPMLAMLAGFLLNSLGRFHRSTRFPGMQFAGEAKQKKLL